MKLKLLIAGVAAMTLVACGDKAAEQVDSAEQVDAAEPTLESVEQRLSYMVGNNIAQQFKRDEINVDISTLTLGIEDVAADKESRLTEEQVQQTIATLQERAQERQKAQQAVQEEEKAKLGDKNKAEGAAFLAENANKEGIVTTESGLQYKEPE